MLFTLRILAYLLLIFGAVICLFNFYLSFLRYPVYWLRGRPSEYKWSSAIPLFGSVFVVVALLLLRGPTFVIAIGISVAALDTGGLHWFVAMMAYMAIWQIVRGDDTSSNDG